MEAQTETHMETQMEMKPQSRRVKVYPAIVRINHWINAVAVIVMVMSGWQIFNASPFWGIHFSRTFTLGGWLGGAILWHFAAMWLLVANALLYLGYNLVSGRWKTKFLPIRPGEVVHDMGEALRGKLSHADPTRYNAVQKLAYVGVMALILGVVLSGIAIWKPVQFELLCDLMGGFDTARRVHFVCMALIVAFIAVHLVMVALVPKTLIAMITGKAKIAEAA